MSARPGPCGGHRATGVPTAIVSHPLVRLSKQLVGQFPVKPTTRELWHDRWIEMPLPSYAEDPGVELSSGPFRAALTCIETNRATNTAK